MSTEIAREDLERAADRIEAGVQNKRLSATPFEIEDVAKICHEANRALCQALGDQSHQPWELCSKMLCDSVISGVKNVLENPALTAEQSHVSWVAYKIAEGWKYGPVKDVELKQHPNLLPYSELAPAEQAKDEQFVAIVRSLAPFTRRHEKAISA